MKRGNIVLFGISLVIILFIAGCGGRLFPPPVCGDGNINSGEQCDGSNLGGKTCQSLGYSGGTLSCKSNCNFDTSACITQCNDNLDNDGDGLTDMQDPGCTGPLDTSELNLDIACDNGVDDDGDSLIDVDDPGCWDSNKRYDSNDNSESNSGSPFECSDTIDNDGDGLIDYPNDPDCGSIIYHESTGLCKDSIDNDNDGLIDTNDPGCWDSNQVYDSSDNSESNLGSPFECSDTIDNDGDGLIDYPNDLGCNNLFEDNETDPPVIWNAPSGYDLNTTSVQGGTKVTLSGINLVNGKIGKALNFNGVDDYVEVSDDSSLDIIDQVTISAWVKIDDLQTQTALIAMKGGLGNKRNYGMWIRNGDKAHLSYFNGSSNYWFDSNIALTLGEWHHIVGITDTINNYRAIYIDSNLAPNDYRDTFIPEMQTNDLPFYIGSLPLYNGSINNWPINGVIDELSIWNKVLSPNEINIIYNNGNGIRPDLNDINLLAYYGFDEGGATVKDLSNNDNDGTVSTIATNVEVLVPHGETIDLRNVAIMTTVNFTVISGLSLPPGVTKKFTVNIPGRSTSQLCIVDEEGATTTTPDCANGVIIDCPGITGQYICSVEGDIYTISGVSNTGGWPFGWFYQEGVDLSCIAGEDFVKDQEEACISCIKPKCKEGRSLTRSMSGMKDGECIGYCSKDNEFDLEFLKAFFIPSGIRDPSIRPRCPEGCCTGRGTACSSAAFLQTACSKIGSCGVEYYFDEAGNQQWGNEKMCKLADMHPCDAEAKCNGMTEYHCSWINYNCNWNCGN